PDRRRRGACPGSYARQPRSMLPVKPFHLLPCRFELARRSVHVARCQASGWMRERRGALVAFEDKVVGRPSRHGSYGRAMTNNERTATKIMASAPTARRSHRKHSRKPDAAAADPLTLYLQEIGRYRLLTRAEEVQLAKGIERGDQQAKERLINSNLRLVVS